MKLLTTYNVQVLQCTEGKSDKIWGTAIAVFEGNNWKAIKFWGRTGTKMHFQILHGHPKYKTYNPTALKLNLATEGRKKHYQKNYQYIKASKAWIGNIYELFSKYLPDFLDQTVIMSVANPEASTNWFIPVSPEVPLTTKPKKLSGTGFDYVKKQIQGKSGGNIFDAPLEDDQLQEEFEQELEIDLGKISPVEVVSKAIASGAMTPKTAKSFLKSYGYSSDVIPGLDEMSEPLTPAQLKAWEEKYGPSVKNEGDQKVEEPKKKQNRFSLLD